MTNTIKKKITKGFLLFLFTFFSVGVQAQWDEYGNLEPDPLAVWLINNFPQGDYTRNEDGTFTVESTMSSEDYGSYINSSSFNGCYCIKNHTDPNAVEEHTIVCQYDLGPLSTQGDFSGTLGGISVTSNAEGGFSIESYEDLWSSSVITTNDSSETTTPPPPSGAGGTPTPEEDCPNPPVCQEGYNLVNCGCEKICTNRTVCDTGSKLVNCECVAVFKWYIDKDDDGFSSSILETFVPLPSPGPQYIAGIPFGPDCDDNNINVNKNNSCGKCLIEPLNGNCKDCDLKIEEMRNAFPNTNYTRLLEIVNAINKYGANYGLDTKEKLQHFLAQAAHESKNVETGKEFEGLDESFNRSWRKLGTKLSRYFNPIDDPAKDPKKANPNDYKRVNEPTSEWVDAEKFANFFYDDNNPLRKNKIGNTEKGDGYKYRGRGIWQLTGKDNYRGFNKHYQANFDDNIDLIKNPDLVSTNIEIAVISALWHYKSRVKIEINETTTVELVTLKLNGGDEGLESRIKQYDKTYANIKNCK